MARSPVLNRPLVLEEATRSSDGAGGQRLVWVEKGRLWAEVVSERGGERAGEFVTLSATAFRITVRGAPPGAPSRPRADQRFREGARVFRILAVTERDAFGRYLLCFAREEVVT